MKWSKYSVFFKSERNGNLLYNSASNSFLKVDDDSVSAITEIIKSASTFDFTEAVDLYFTLRSNGFIVEDSQDEDLYNITRMRRTTANYASPVLALTIAPTRACNFACTYCYEKDREPRFMSDETQDKIIAFIERYRSVKKLSIIWYGGEPLIAFDRIVSLNEKIKATGKDYRSMIVTNGYCLGDAVIGELGNLKADRIQVTLDGCKKTHDGRRFLLGGGATYDVIIANLDRLMASAWEGFVSVRVNVDATNEGEFFEVYRLIKERYPEQYGKRISVYPGFVHDNENPDIGCQFDAKLKGKFLLEQARKHGIHDLPIFPKRVSSGCVAEMRNGYVIGPEGELYKCWDDIGKPDLVVGSVDSICNWNMGLVARYMVASSYLDSAECRECTLFPVCDGGCANIRRKNLEDGKKRDHCSYFKSHLRELLELHYEQKTGKGESSDEN